MEITNKISVLVRVRPLVSSEQKPAWIVSDNTISPLETSKHQGASLQRFSFDGVYDPSVTTRELYAQTMANFAAHIVEGYNCTCFAYGQSCSGKTFTIFGDCLEANSSSTSSLEHTCPGILPLCVKDLFNNLQSVTNRFFVVYFTYWELYNEELKDLLAGEKHRLEIRYTKHSMQVSCVEKRVGSLEDVLSYLRFGNRLREVAATDLNTVSSRSHAIARLTIESVDTALLDELVKANKLPPPDSIEKLSDYDISYRTATLTIVDLAGSERQVKTNAIGERFKEANNINKSLLTLGRVFSAITSNAAHVPYRDSNLTKILQTSLQGNCYTTMIACISLASEHIEETLSTLRYASNASSIEMRVHSNEVLAENNAMIRLETERQQLAIRVRELEERCRSLEANAGSLEYLTAESGAHRLSGTELTEPELKKLAFSSSGSEHCLQSIALSPLSLSATFTERTPAVPVSTRVANTSPMPAHSLSNLSQSIFRCPQDVALWPEARSSMSSNAMADKGATPITARVATINDMEVVFEDIDKLDTYNFETTDSYTCLDLDLEEVASCFYPEKACYVQTDGSVLYRPINTLSILSLASVDDILKQIESELEKMQEPAVFLAEKKQDIDEALEANAASSLYGALHDIKQGIISFQDLATDAPRNRLLQLVSDLDQAYRHSYEASVMKTLNTMGLLAEDVSLVRSQADKYRTEIEGFRDTLDKHYVPIEECHTLSRRVESLTQQLALETARVESTTTLLNQCQATSEGMVIRLEELTKELASAKKEKEEASSKFMRLKTILNQAKAGILELRNAYISQKTALVTLKKEHVALLAKMRKLQKYKEMVVQQHQMMEALKANSAATAQSKINAGKAGVKGQLTDAARELIAPSQKDIDNFVDGILQGGDTGSGVEGPLKPDFHEENQLLSDLLDECS
ncbi:Kinesin-7 [Giardia duodenalis]|uniref:Kinesin-like protein n=1 Tax=Giardia intestinalis (strain ATCC 50803 / WB clone C6) TaxID=184922 RepID=A8BN58_GIAIC|nr:Kinesin-7 [Giardia intestinalis]KAE8301243.1 Kinesin-7 [Giardia intestinalis]|eukprot:XP_001706032.1 Kinesin-7 [Giardia lamblia ATCC 50803]